MKKLISLLLALCLLALCGAAFAEEEVAESEQSLPEINWTDVEEEVAMEGWKGDWELIDDWNLGFYLPTLFNKMDLSELEVDEDGNESLVAVYTNADQNKALILMSFDLDEDIVDAESFAALKQAEGYADAEVVRVNGKRMVSYMDDENDQLIGACVYDDHTALVFVYAPASDDTMMQLARYITASVMPYDEAVALMQ